MKAKIDHDSKIIEKSIKEANDQYKDALDNMPTAGTLVGLAFTDSICSVLNCLTVGISASFARSDNAVFDPAANPKSGTNILNCFLKLFFQHFTAQHFKRTIILD